MFQLDYRELPYWDAKIDVKKPFFFEPCPFPLFTRQITGPLFAYLHERSIHTLTAYHPSWLIVYAWELLYCSVSVHSEPVALNKLIDFSIDNGHSIVTKLWLVAENNELLAFRKDYLQVFDLVCTRVQTLDRRNYSEES